MKKILLFTFFAFYSFIGLCQKSSKKDYLIKISTSFGDMYAILFDATPKHKANFIKLAEEKFYDSTLFHRVIKEFMIQGGDPKSKTAKPGEPLGSGDNGYTVPAEFVEGLFHKKGALASARTNNPQKASSGCQFYIVQGKKYSDEELSMLERNMGKKLTEEQKNIYKSAGGVPHLDGAYTVYGEVIKGLEVIDSIADQPKDPYDRPTTNIPMKVSSKLMKKKKITKLYGYQYKN